MKKLDTLKKELVNTIHEELTGDLAIALSKSHFDLLEERTGLSKRKLKEIFGIYKPRSRQSHDYTMDKLAEFAGFKSWSDFIKTYSADDFNERLSQKRLIELRKKISVKSFEQKKVQISIMVK